MAHPGNTMAHPGPGKFRAWLNDALRRHRVWLWVNLAGMTAVSAIETVSSHRDLNTVCFPGPIGNEYDWAAMLVLILTWSGNTVALLVGLILLNNNTAEKRLTLLGLWLLTPVLWILFVGVARDIAGPDCCKISGMC